MTMEEVNSETKEAFSPKCSIYTAQIDLDTGPSQVEQLIKAIKDQHKKPSQGSKTEDESDKGDKSRLVVLGNRAVHEEAVSVSEFFIRLWRLHRLHNNERQTVISAEDQMVVVQLCLAGINKQKIGDFDVEASTVIEMQRTLVGEKLKQISDRENSSSPGDDYKELREAYDTYLSHCNMLDIIDVFSKVREEVTCNRDLMKDLYSSIFVTVTKPQGLLEMELMKFVSERCVEVKICRLCQPLAGGENTDKTFLEMEQTSLDRALDICEEIKPSANSVTEMHVKGVVLSYIQLLVNSRSELGLARSLNVPDRKLDHNAFTALKREAQGKGLSMYQTATSFIMRLRMGGSGYASTADSPLGPYVKGMSEYIDMMHKLQTVIEEDTNVAKAVKRVVNLIKNSIKKNRDNLLRPESIENVATQLQEHASLIQLSLGSTNFNSPNRPANMGGSMLGRDTLRVLRHLLDTHAGCAMPTNSVDVLSDAISSQKTPLRFPSLLSKFRSPVEVSPDGKIERSLSERMAEKMGKTEHKVSAVPRYQSCYDWAEPLHHVSFGEREVNTIKEYVPSKTMVCPAESKKSTGPRRILESILDQENVIVSSGDQIELVSSQSSSHPPPQKSKSASVKRPAGQENTLSAPPSKKSKPAPKAKAGKTSKKNTLPLQKGQKQLTSFFRM